MNKNAIMQVTYSLNGSMINFLFYRLIILLEEKVISYDKISHSLTLEVQLGK